MNGLGSTRFEKVQALYDVRANVSFVESSRRASLDLIAE